MGGSSGSVNKNIVAVSGNAKITQISDSYYFGQIVVGGYSSDSANVEENQVVISDSAYIAGTNNSYMDYAADGIIVGGVTSGSGALTGNSVTVSGNANVTAKSNGYSYGPVIAIVGGSRSGSGDVTKNTVTVSGGAINGDVIGGAMLTSNSSATVVVSYNIVKLKGGTIDGTVYGGASLESGWDSDSGDYITTVTAITGNSNEVNILEGTNTVGGIDGYETLNISGGESEVGSIVNKSAAINVTGGETTVTTSLNNTGGTIQIGKGTLNLAGTISGTGTITVGDNTFDEDNLTGTSIDTIDAVLNISVDNSLSSLTVKNDANFKVSGGAAVSVTSLESDGIINVGNSTLAGSLSVASLTGTGVLFADLAWSDNEEKNIPENASKTVVNTWNGNSAIVIAQNSIGILGRDAIMDKAVTVAENIKNDSQLAWGEPSESAPKNIGALLIVTENQTVKTTGALVVDQKLVDVPSESDLNNYKGNITVGEQSLLLAGGESISAFSTTPSSVKLTATKVNNSGYIFNLGTLSANQINNEGTLITSLAGLDTAELNLESGSQLETIANATDIDGNLSGAVIFRADGDIHRQPQRRGSQHL